MAYAIVKIGGKQYRVQEGERLLVDRLKTEPGKTFTPDVLLVDGDLGSKTIVTARVVDHVRGKKIRIGKYRPKSGYRRHTGFRAGLSRIEIEAIGAKRAAAANKPEPAAEKPKAPAARARDWAPASSRPARAEKAEAPKGLPKDYASLTVSQIAEAAPGWRRPQLDAALAYEQEHGQRKGALSALESALAAKEES